jgi:protein-S-isoprenylcysteine O-methyltransferase Ste14
MTDPQRSAAEIKNEWGRRRRRQSMGARIVAAVVVLWFLAVFTPAVVVGTGEERSPTYFTQVFVGLMFVNLGLALWNRRCPACGKDPGGAFQPMWAIKKCKKCGAKLRD